MPPLLLPASSEVVGSLGGWKPMKGGPVGSHGCVGRGAAPGGEGAGAGAGGRPGGRAGAGAVTARAAIARAQVRVRPALAGVDTLVLFPLIDAADRNEEGRRARVLEGTRRSLEAAAGAATVVLWSSGVVYGAHPDNPVPIPETQPPRPNPEFPAAGILAESEQVALAAGESRDLTASERVALAAGES